MQARSESFRLKVASASARDHRLALETRPLGVVSHGRWYFLHIEAEASLGPPFAGTHEPERAERSEGAGQRAKAGLALKVYTF